MKFQRQMLTAFLVVSGVTVSMIGAQTPSPPNPQQLVKKLLSSYSWTNSVAMSIEIQERLGRNPKKFPVVTRSLTYRRDHDKVEWRGEGWLLDETGNRDLPSNAAIKTIFDGHQGLLVQGPSVGPLFKAGIYEKFGDKITQAEESSLTGGYLNGRSFGNDGKSIAELLQSSIELKNMGTENIDGTRCNVVEGRTSYGVAKAWIAPELNGTCLRWTLEKGPDDLLGATTLRDQHIKSWFIITDKIKVQNLGGVYVIVSGSDQEIMVEDDNKERFITSDCTRSNIILNPNFSKLDAFHIDLPEGTKVYLDGQPHTWYHWHDGKPTVTDDTP